MPCRRARAIRRRRSAIVWCLIAAAGLAAASSATAQVNARPAAVERFELDGLAGDWYEVASTGSGPHRRCLGDTRFTVARPAGRHADVVRTCTTPGGLEVRRGRVRAPRDGTGALDARFAPAVFAWLPMVWDETWVLAVGDERTWVLLGDRRRQHLAVWARVVSLPESSLAVAIGEARRQGFDVERLVTVPHPAGASGPGGR
jgi:apolipoprotein D and lipocalin family protein